LPQSFNQARPPFCRRDAAPREESGIVRGASPSDVRRSGVVVCERTHRTFGRTRAYSL
jgi:hypothetical protein